LLLTRLGFNQKFKDSPLKRAKRRGYLRNIAIAAGNSQQTELLPVLEHVEKDDEPLVCAYVQWAIAQIKAGKITS
jgi:epoxyqueuosine reductase